MSSTLSAAANIAGVRLHPEAERRYRERTRRSLALLEQTSPLIPTGHAGGMWYQLPYPVLLERGDGARVWDVDGNRYLDMRIGDWVMALGHRNETVRDAIVAQLDRASQLGCPEWDLAHRMASLLIDRMPSVERVRFLASGTESNLLALRLARAHTGGHKLGQGSGELSRHRGRTRGGGLFDQLRFDGHPRGRHPRRGSGRRRVSVQRPGRSRGRARA